MNTGRLVRFSFFEVTLLLVVIGVGIAASYALREVQRVDRMRPQLRFYQAQYINIATNVHTAVDAMNDSLLAYATRQDRAVVETFRKQSRGFSDWIAAQSNSMSAGKMILVEPLGFTFNTISLLGDVEQAFNTYLAEAQRLMADYPTGTVKPLNIEDVSKRVRTGSHPLIRIANHAEASAKALDLFVTGNARWVVWLRRLMTASVLALAALATWLAVLIYRRVVSPLRVRLDETQAIIERQKEIARFGEFAAMVAHEIRNPLTAIKVRVFSLEQNMPPDSPDVEHTTVIGNEVNRLDQIVRDFLESARPAEPRLAPTTAGALLQQAYQLLAPTCEKRDIALTLEPGPDAPLLADSSQLKQVLINLIQNAADSITGTGRITLRTRTGRRALKGKPVSIIALDVQDTGSGIPPEIQKRLFDPFFSTKKDGSGLGLAIAAGIVERHGGLLDFQTQTGRGTTFSIVLPVQESPA